MASNAIELKFTSRLHKCFFSQRRCFHLSGEDDKVQNYFNSEDSKSSSQAETILCDINSAVLTRHKNACPVDKN